MSPHKLLFPFLVFLILSMQTVFADAGPKPGMNFKMVYKTSKPVKVLEGWQLQSPFESFTVADTLKREGPQRLIVNQQDCKSVSYGYKDFQKLILRFDDTTRQSNVFANESFNSVYEVTVYDNRLEVRDVTPFMKNSTSLAVFLKALMLTLILELLVAFVYLKLSKKPLKILIFVILGNLITLPLVWFVFPLFLNGWAIPVGEVVAFVLEALFLLLTCRRYFRPSGAFLLSFMMNFMSFLIGGLALLLMIGF